MNNLFSDEALPAGSPEISPGQQAQTIRLTAQFENLDLIRAFVSQWAEACGLAPKAVYAVQLAVDEAFTNIVEHAYGGECEENIKCTCQITENALVVMLRDCGQPFDPQRVPKPDLEAQLKDRGVGGLGLYFIRKLMDEVEFFFIMDPEEERKCNVLRMVKLKEIDH